MCRGLASWLPIGADDIGEPLRQFGYGAGLEGIGEQWRAINGLPPLTVRQHCTWCNDKAADTTYVDAVWQLATPIAERLTFPLLEEQVSTAARCSCHRHVGKVAAVGAQKSVEGLNAVITAGMPIAVDDDEPIATHKNGRQCGAVAEPPIANLLRLGARLFLPAN